MKQFRSVPRRAGDASLPVLANNFQKENLIIACNRTMIVLAVACVAMAVARSSPTADAALILVNFGDTAYTTDGANTWQTFDIQDPTGGFGGTGGLMPLASTGLSDTTGSSSGVSLAVTGVDVGAFDFVFDNAGASQGQFASPASGTQPSWFDDTSAEQREGYAFFDYDITYTFSGFAASDTVQFDFAVGVDGLGPGDRSTTLSYPAGSTTLLSDVQTDAQAHYATISGLTGSTSYAFLVESKDLATGTSLINAIGVTVESVALVPEPSTFLLAALSLVGLLFCGRRRKR